MSVILIIFTAVIFPLVLCGIYDSYATPNLFGQPQFNNFNSFGGLFNPLFPSFPTNFGWPQYGSVTPWSNGGLFGLTRATGQSDRYGGNLGYNYGCLPFCRNGGGFL